MAFDAFMPDRQELQGSDLAGIHDSLHTNWIQLSEYGFGRSQPHAGRAVTAAPPRADRAEFDAFTCKKSVIRPPMP